MSALLSLAATCLRHSCRCPLLLLLFVMFSAGARSAWGQGKPFTVVSYNGMTANGTGFYYTYYNDEWDWDGYAVKYYRVSFTVKNTSGETASPWVEKNCGAFCGDRGVSQGPTYTNLAPNQTAIVYVDIEVPISGSASSAIWLRATRDYPITCWDDEYEMEYTCSHVPGNVWDQLTVNVTSTNGTPTVQFEIAAYRPLVTPKAALETIPFASAMSRSFTIQNAGTQTATYAITASCGSISPCTPSKTSTTLVPGAIDNVDVSFTSPNTLMASNTLKVMATFTNLAGQAIADTGTRPTVTPVIRVAVSPKNETFVAANGAGSHAFFVSLSSYSPISVSASCTGWLTSCYVETEPYDNDYLVTVFFSGQNALGGPTYPTSTIRLIAQAGTVADTAWSTVVMGYSKPAFTPRTSSVTVPALTTISPSITLKNSGNMANGYSVGVQCGGSVSCQNSGTWVYLEPGQSNGLPVSYKAPPAGETGTLRVIATRQAGSIVEADTALINATGEDLLKPTITVTGDPLESGTIYTGVQNFVIVACDQDGQLQTPTITVNGVAVTPSFTTTTTGSCASRKEGTLSFVAAPGANTVSISVSDGIHTPQPYVRHFTYLEAGEATPVVTALVANRLLRDGQQWADTFSVRNPGPLTVTYTLGAGCVGAYTSCAPTSPSIVVGPNQTVKMAVNYTTSASTTGLTVWPIVTYTAVGGGAVTVNDAYTSITIDRIAPTATISGVAPGSTIDTLPSLSVAWCDPDGQLASHTVTVDGIPLVGNFVAQAIGGCTSAGISTWSKVPVDLGQHTVVARVADVAGHDTTATLTFTLSLPAVAEFKPEVTPRTSTPSLIPKEQTLTWAVRNVGTRPAQYQLTADCSEVVTASGCALDKTSVTLPAGAVDSVRMTFALTGWPAAAKTLRLIARYTDIVGRVIADTGSLSGQIPSIASLYQPQIQQPAGAFYQELNNITGYSFAVKNTGIAPVTYRMEESVTAPFALVHNYVNDTLTIQPGQTMYYMVQVASPATNGQTGQIAVRASYTFDGQTVSSTVVVAVVTRATRPVPVITNTSGPSHGINGSTGRTTFRLENIGVGTLEGEVSPSLYICNGIVSNCRYLPRTGGRSISLSPGAATDIPVEFDIAPGTETVGHVSLKFEGKTGTLSAGEQYGSVTLIRSTVASGVIVLPKGETRWFRPNRDNLTYTFTITNTGADSAKFEYSITCASAGAPGSASSVSCPTVQSETRWLQHDKADTIAAHFSTSGVDSAGYVTLQASKSGNSTIQDIGRLTVRLSTTTADIAVVTKTINSGASVTRGECLTISAAQNAAYECGDLRIVHALPATTTMNKTRAPTLMYNSAHAKGHGVIVGNVQVRPGIAIDSLLLTLKIKNNQGDVAVSQSRAIAWHDTLSDGQWRRVALQFNAADSSLVDPGKQAGLFEYVFEARSKNDAALVAQDTGFVAIVDRSSSVFGKGWWLDGLEQLIPLGDESKKLWIGGDGSARMYSWVAGNLWTAQPELDRVDSLVKVNETLFRRRLPNGAYVEFNSTGEHVRTVNQQQHVTTFAYSDGVLSSITLPVKSGTAPRYQFDYETVGSLTRLTTIHAPVADSTRDVTVVYEGNTRDVRGISGPTADMTRFTVGANGLIATRTNRREYVTTFGFNSAGLMDTVAVQVGGGTPNIITRFCPAESASLTTKCQSGVPLAGRVRTLFDGPRPIGDTLSFTIDAFGAPSMIVNAVGDTTWIERNHPRWRRLPTAVVKSNGRPGGHRVNAEYDGNRGVLLRAVEHNPFGDGDSSVTRYTWHETLDKIKTVIGPMGERTDYGYATNGNRLWQQDGRGDTTRVNFEYNAENQISFVQPPGHTSAQREALAYEPVRGNLYTVTSPLGLVTTFNTDGLGRVTSTLSPIDGTRVMTDSTRYDRYDRAVKHTQSGQTALTGSFSSLTVTNTYDKEHNLTRVVQTATPDPKGITSLTRFFTFDGADRQIGEGVGYPWGDTELFHWYFDEAGNLVSGGRDAVNVTLAYDAANRLETRSGDNPATFTYAKTGGIETANNTAARIRRTYYPNGALKGDTSIIAIGMSPDFDLAETYGLSMTYDLSGRRTQVRYPSSVAGPSGAATYQYDPLSGALNVVTDWLNASYRYRYDAAGRLRNFIWRSGQADSVRETRGYDLDSRMTRRTVQQGSQTLKSDSLIYDQRGKVVQVGTDTFRYDGRGRTTYSRFGAVEETLSLDGFGNITQRDGVRSPPGWGDYVYEPYRGRLTGQSNVGSQGHNDTTAFGYNNVGNQLARHSYVEGAMNNGSGQNIITFRSLFEDDYNDANQLWRHRFTWDTVYSAIGDGNFSNAQTSVQPYYSVETYRYDALGRRVWVGMQRDTTCRRQGSPEENTGCATTVRRVVWDGSQIIAEIQDEDGISAPANGWYSGIVTYTHGLGIDQPLTMTRNGYALQLTPSWHGGVEGSLCTPNCILPAVLPSRSTFGPTGLQLSAWYGSLVTSGQDASGYLHRRNRYLDPKAGRFTQEDPIGLDGGMNLYGFADGDPVNFADPFGLKVCFQGSGAEISDLKKTTESATNTTFSLDKKNCVDPASVRSGGDKRFDALRAGFNDLVGSDDTFSIGFGAEAESPQYNPYKISIFRDADALAYSTGAWGKCDGGRAAFSFPQVMAHELKHHVPVARGGKMTSGTRGENDAVRTGDNIYNAASGRPLRCRY